MLREPTTGSRTISGVHKLKPRTPSWVPLLGMVIACLGVFGSAWKFLESRAEGKAAAGVRAAQNVKEDLESHKKADEVVHAQILAAARSAQEAAEQAKQSARDAQLDIRAVYRYQLEGQRQPRLERAPR